MQDYTFLFLLGGFIVVSAILFRLIIRGARRGTLTYLSTDAFNSAIRELLKGTLESEMPSYLVFKGGRLGRITITFKDKRAELSGRGASLKFIDDTLRSHYNIRPATEDPWVQAVESFEEKGIAVRPDYSPEMEEQVALASAHPGSLPKAIVSVCPPCKATDVSVLVILLSSIIGAIAGSIVTALGVGVIAGTTSQGGPTRDIPPLYRLIVLLFGVGLALYLPAYAVSFSASAGYRRRGGNPKLVKWIAAGCYLVVTALLWFGILGAYSGLPSSAVALVGTALATAGSVIAYVLIDEEKLGEIRFCESCRAPLLFKELVETPIEGTTTIIQDLGAWDLSAIPQLLDRDLPSDRTSLSVWGCPQGHFYLLEMVVVREIKNEVEKRVVFSAKLNPEQAGMMLKTLAGPILCDS